MDAKGATEGAALGFLSYGSLALILSPSPLSFFFSGLAGALLGAAYGLLRNLPWKRYFQSRGKQACVSVHPRALTFFEVSTKAPPTLGFIRFTGMDKVQVFEKLEGKRLNPETLPFAWRVHMEERRDLEIPFEALEPYLMELK